MNRHHSQKGGAIRLPYRWYNNQVHAFQSCDSQCPKIHYYGKKQKGGAIRMPYRWFNQNATPFQPCANCMKYINTGHGCANCMKMGQGGGAYDYYNDFGNPGCHGYNSCNMTYPGNLGEKQKQKGGNPIQAPLYVFTGGQPLTQSYPMYEGPVFDRVGRDYFW